MEPKKFPIAKLFQKQSWFAGIDSLRFVLALIVVLGHCTIPMAKRLKESNIPIEKHLGQFMGVLFNGPAAVIAFFVISGFVIHYPNKNGIKSLSDFYVRRFVRILIPLIAIAILGSFFNNPHKAIVWSLYCELVYYAIYPVIYKIKATWNQKILCSFFLALTCICIGSPHSIESMVCQSDINYDGRYNELGYYYTWIVGLPCWLLGVKLANEIDNFIYRPSELRIWTMRIFIFALSSFTLILRFHFFISDLINLTLLSIPLYHWINMEIKYYKTKVPMQMLERMGKFSYSLYLSHPLLLVILYENIPLTDATYFVYLTIIIISSYIFYLLFERPSHLFAKKMVGSKAKVS